MGVMKSGGLALLGCAFYFGQPVVGFFFASDFLTDSCQSPSIFNSSGLGPGCAGGFFAGFLVFFILLRLGRKIWFKLFERAGR